MPYQHLEIMKLRLLRIWAWSNKRDKSTPFIRGCTRYTSEGFPTFIPEYYQSLFFSTLYYICWTLYVYKLPCYKSWFGIAHTILILLRTTITKHSGVEIPWYFISTSFQLLRVKMSCRKLLFQIEDFYHTVSVPVFSVAWIVLGEFNSMNFLGYTM